MMSLIVRGRRGCTALMDVVHCQRAASERGGSAKEPASRSRGAEQRVLVAQRQSPAHELPGVQPGGEYGCISTGGVAVVVLGGHSGQ